MPDYLNTTHRTVTWFKKAHDEGILVMKPPFQRNPVWTEAQKSYLIDSILHGYPVPELYMQEEVDEHGGEQHIVVDGQQRTRACLEFLEGKFTMNPEQSPKWADMSFEELSSDEKKRVFGYEFVIRKLPSVPDAQLRDIFQRLNRNVIALNDQELRHATYWGPFIKLMERLADLDYWEGTGLFSAEAVRRMLDIEYISELAIAALHGVQNKKQTLDKWYATYETKFDESSALESLFTTVLGELNQILPEIRRTRWRKRSDFYTLFHVFACHQESLPLSKTARGKMEKRLMAFAGDVDRYVSVEKEGDKAKLRRIPKELTRYAVAVQRAASDLGNRKERSEALEEVLASVWG